MYKEKKTKIFTLNFIYIFNLLNQTWNITFQCTFFSLFACGAVPSVKEIDLKYINQNSIKQVHVLINCKWSMCIQNVETKFSHLSTLLSVLTIKSTCTLYT